MPQIQRPPAFSGLVIYVFHLGSALDDSCSLRVALHFLNNDPKLQPTVAWESEAEVFLLFGGTCGVWGRSALLAGRGLLCFMYWHCGVCNEHPGALAATFAEGISWTRE